MPAPDAPANLRSQSTPPPPHEPDWPRAVAEHAPDLTTVVRGDGRIVYDGPSVLRILGYEQGELVGRNAFELIHPADIPAALALLVDTAAAPGRVSSLIYRFRHRDGSWRFLESVGTTVAEGGGAVVVTSRDMTDHVRALEALRRGRDELEARARTRGLEVEEMQMEMLGRLAHAAEIRDDETGTHTRRVATLAGRIAEAMSLDSGLPRVIQSAAPLHDIGKIGVPDAILRKPGPLTSIEMGVMRTHTLIGGRILAGGRSELMRCAELIALHHHERWDGGGYPHAIAGPRIPIPARIVAVADFFDALTHDRAYRAALPQADVARQIEDGAGSHFDPEVVEAFRSVELPSPVPRSAAAPRSAALPDPVAR